MWYESDGGHLILRVAREIGGSVIRGLSHRVCTVGSASRPISCHSPWNTFIKTSILLRVVSSV